MIFMKSLMVKINKKNDDFSVSVFVFDSQKVSFWAQTRRNFNCL